MGAIGGTDCSEVKINRPYNPKRSGAKPMDCDWCSSHESNTTKTACKTVRGSSKKQCTFMMAYEDESHFSAALYNDSFTFAVGANGITDLHIHAAVGSMYYAKFDNPKMIDGIIGFGGFQDTTTGAPTPFDVLVKEQRVQDVFSICLHPRGNGGHLYLGADGPGDAAHLEASSPMTIQGTRILDTQWTPLIGSTGFYGIGVEDVLVGGVSIGVDAKVYNDGLAIVDSGTQDVNVPATAFTALKEHFEALCHQGVCLKGVCNCDEKKPLTRPIFENRCDRMTQQEKDAFPVVEFKLTGGATVEYPPSNYLKNGAAFCDKDSLDHYTIAISSTGPDGSGSILGESLMEGYLIVHDRKNSRMGFQPVSEANCPGMANSQSVVV